MRCPARSEKGAYDADISHRLPGHRHPGLPVLAVGQNDTAFEATRQRIDSLNRTGAAPLRLRGGGGAGRPAGRCDPSSSYRAPGGVQSFYPMASDLTPARGDDPDRPEHLRKVTKTK